MSRAPWRHIAHRIVGTRPAAPLAAGLVLLATVAGLDWATGPELDFSLFYLVPVGCVTWWSGPAFGCAVSAASAAVWLAVDRQTGARPMAPLPIAWNLGARLAFFCGSVVLLEGWKRAGKHLSAMVEQRTAAMRRLAAQLSAAEEEERRKLALDLHDAVSQGLAMVKINLDAAHQEAAGRPELQRRLAESAATIEGLSAQARTLMFDLYPAMLEDLGLVPTLEWYARQLGERAGGVEVVVSEQGTRRALPRAMANYLFRACKELLGNAVRHGRAKEVVVVAHWERGALRLVIDDDGVGFDASTATTTTTTSSAPPPAGLGLRGIRERLGSMGGRLELESRAGQGARAILEVPVREGDEADGGWNARRDGGHDHARAAG